jgi:hypothetical protein
MTDNTALQSQLSSYAQEVLRHNGIKSCRTRWTAADVLSIEVDPSRVAKARPLLSIIQQRGGTAVRVELHEPSAADLAAAQAPKAPDPFAS